LISPPGSPKEGWVQVEEDPPNPVTLHEDIQAALDRLAQDLGQHDDDERNEIDEGQGNVILDTTSLGGVQVIVHDWDSMADTNDGIGGNGIRETRTSSVAIGRTPMPQTDQE
jgi:Calcipressin